MLREFSEPTLLNALRGAHSQITKERLRLATLSDPDAFKRCMSQAQRSKKSVLDCHGRVFESTTEAAKFYGISRTSVGKICNGNTKLKSVKGLTFRWMEAA